MKEPCKTVLSFFFGQVTSTEAAPTLISFPSVWLNGVFHASHALKNPIDFTFVRLFLPPEHVSSMVQYLKTVLQGLPPGHHYNVVGKLHSWSFTQNVRPSKHARSKHLRYDLIDSDHIAFMFNVGTFPDLSIHPIDT